MDTQLAVRAEHFTARQADKVLLDDISMQVRADQITAIIGPAGSGKSIFLRCINRLLERNDPLKTTGTLEVLGENIYNPKTDLMALRRRVGIVFSQPALPVGSIFDNVAMAPRMAGVNDKQHLAAVVEECLKRVDLWGEVSNRLNASAAACTHEQQQRLCMARVLANRPKLILLDEPTADMDYPSVSHMEDIICDLASDHAILLAAQTPQQASHVADTTAFFLHGALVEMGPTDEILTCPKNPQTEAYVSGRYA